MPTIRVETLIRAPAERCFDLARDPELQTRSLAGTGERVVARTGSGLLGLGDVVTFEAVHFGVRQRLTAQISRCEPPLLFEDRQVQGTFRSFTHVHEFRATDEGTLMIDVFEFRSPLGVIGVLTDRLFPAHHMPMLYTTYRRQARHIDGAREPSAASHA